MVMIKAKSRKLHKIDTDKYELAWHPANNHETYSVSVWETPAYVGPEAYNAGHIDYILGNNPRNDVRTVINSDNGIYVCRRNLDKGRIRFTP